MANNKPPAVKIQGFRGSIPSGYLLGRADGGQGDVQLISMAKAQSVGLIPATLPPSGTAGGDLSGIYPNPTVAKIQGRAVSASAPATTNVLAWSGTAWAPLALGAVAYTNNYTDLTGLPPLTGGTTGQVLTKTSNSDYAFNWQTPGSSSGGGAGSAYDDGTNFYLALLDSHGQIVLDGSGDPIWVSEVLPVAAIPALPYSSNTLTSAHLFVGNGSNVATDVALSGDATITNAGVITIKTDVALAGNPTTTTQSASDSSTRVATTAFTAAAIANAVAGVNPAVSVKAATTVAGDTSSFTYANGVGGIGATLTGPTANVAITFDGVTLTAIGQRVLVKNDTQSPSGAFNGVYSLTILQAIGIKPVLTRALDYNSPSDINNTGAVPVVSGTVNALTSWLLTSSVTTVGTDPLTYVEFSFAPTFANPTATGSDVAVNGSATTFMRSDAAPAIQKASSSVFGLVKVDAVTIQAVAGLIGAKACAFYVTLVGDQSVTVSVNTVLLANTVALDTLGAYNAANGKYTPTKAGTYLFFASLRAEAAGVVSYAEVFLQKNGSGILVLGLANPLGIANTTSTVIVVLAVVSMNGSTDYVTAVGLVVAAGGSDVFVGASSQCSFGAVYLGA